MNALTYQTQTNSIKIDGIKNLFIRSLLDRQQYYDPTGAAARLGICSASWSLFGMLWPSSTHLASALAKRPLNLNEKILEIGCGLALASLVGHRLGANITTYDRHPKTKLFLEENLRLNNLSKLPFRHGQWGEHPVPSTKDTGAALLTKKYDLVIGSDLLYESDMPKDLARFVDECANPNAGVRIVDPNRGYRTAFNKKMGLLGFQLSSEASLSEVEITDEKYKGRLLILDTKKG